MIQASEAWAATARPSRHSCHCVQQHLRVECHVLCSGLQSVPDGVPPEDCRLVPLFVAIIKHNDNLAFNTVLWIMEKQENERVILIYAWSVDLLRYLFIVSFPYAWNIERFLCFQRHTKEPFDCIIYFYVFYIRSTFLNLFFIFTPHLFRHFFPIMPPTMKF